MLEYVAAAVRGLVGCTNLPGRDEPTTGHSKEELATIYGRKLMNLGLGS